MLKLSPDSFRAMSVCEFCLAVDGHMMASGVKQEGITKNEVLEMDRAWRKSQSKN